MTQLIINNTLYPTTSRDKYICTVREVGNQQRMSTGYTVFQHAYDIWAIEYTYDYFEPALMRKAITDLRLGAIVDVQFLAPDSDELQSGQFIVTRRPTPTFAFAKNGVPYWHNISFALEGADAIA